MPATLAGLASGALKDKYLGRKSVARPTRKRATPRRRKMLSALGGDGYRGT
jgi:hypothetical protein